MHKITEAANASIVDKLLVQQAQRQLYKLQSTQRRHVIEGVEAGLRTDVDANEVISGLDSDLSAEMVHLSSLN